MTDTVEKAIYELGYSTGSSKQDLDATRASASKLVQEAERLAVSEEKITRATRSTTEQLERLLAKLDPVIRAEQARQRVMDQVQRLEQEGIGTTTQRARVIDLATQKYLQQVEAINRARVANDTYVQSLNRSSAVQQRINSVTGVGGSAGSYRSQEDLVAIFDAQAQAMDQLRRRYDPLYAASKEYEAAVEEITKAQKIGVFTTEQAEVALEHQRVAFENSTKAGTAFGKSANASRAYMANLSFQINDVVTQLASGQSPFMILAQQGGQFVQIMQQAQMGPVGLLKQVGTLLAGLITPARLAMAGLAGIGVTLVALYASSISNEKAMQAALAGTGRAAGVTTSQLDTMARHAADGANVGVGAARQWAQEYAKSGAVAGGAIEQLTAITADYAHTTGQETDAAVKQLVGSFKNLSTGIDTIDASLGGISFAQKQYIKDLEASGQHNKAVQVAIDAMKPSLVDHEQHLTLIGRLWNNIRNAASAAVASLPASTQQALDAAKAKLAGGGELDENGRLIPGSAAGLQREVNNLTYKLRMEQEAAKRNAAAQVSNELADKAGPVLQSVLPGFADERTLRNNMALLDTLQKNEAALKATGMTAQQAAAGYDAYKNAVESYLTPGERAARQAELEVQAIRAKTPAQKAAVAAAQTALALQGQAISADERSAQVKAAYSAALAQANQQLYVETQSQKIAVNGSIALAQAWLTGANAAMRVTANTEAQTRALTEGGSVSARAAQSITKAAADQAASIAQGVDALKLQVLAQKAANDAVAAGTISYTQAATYAQRYADTQQLEILATNDVVKANKQLLDIINRIIAAKKAANDNSDYEHDRAMLQQINGELEEQNKLAAMSAEERDVATAQLQAQRNAWGTLSQAALDHIGDLVKIRQATERWRSTVDSLTSGFQSAFEDIFENGISRIGSLWDVIKKQFIQLLAWMASQALVAPVIVPIVGQMFGTLGLDGGGGSLGMLASGAQLGGSLGLFGSGAGGLFGGIGSGISSAFAGIGSALGFGSAATAGTAVSLGSIAGVGGAPLALGSVSTGTPALAGSLFGTTTLGGFLGGAGLGALAGNMLFGNKNDASIGSMGGAAAGALAGSLLFPGVGTLLGGLIGGIAGGGLGSLTGSSNQGAIYNFNQDGTGGYLFKQGGGNNGQLSTQAAGSVSQAISTLKAAGVDVSLGNISGISIGSDKSYVYDYAGGKQKLAGGDTQAVVEAVLQRILPSASGTTTEAQAVLAKYRENGGINSSNLQQLVQDLGAAKNFADSLANLKATDQVLTDAGQKIAAINDQYAKLVDQAQQLGLDIGNATVVRNSAFRTLLDGYLDQLDAVGAAANDAGSQWTQALSAITTATQNATEAANALGSGLDEVQAAANGARGRLMGRFNDTIQAAVDQLADPTGYAFDQLLASQKQRLSEAQAVGADIVQVNRLTDLEMQKFFGEMALDQLTAFRDARGAANSAADAALKAANDNQKLIDSYKSLSGSVSDMLGQAQDAAQAAASAASAWAGANESLTKASNALLISDQSLSPIEAYNNARSQFDGLRRKAFGGDAGAAGDLASFASQFLQTSFSYNASTTAYGGDLNYVQQTLRDLAVFSSGQQSLAQQQVDNMSEAVDVLGQIRDAVQEQTGQTNQALASLEGRFNDLAGEIRQTNIQVRQMASK